MLKKSRFSVLFSIPPNAAALLLDKAIRADQTIACGVNLQHCLVGFFGFRVKN